MEIRRTNDRNKQIHFMTVLQISGVYRVMEGGLEGGVEVFGQIGTVVSLVMC